MLEQEPIEQLKQNARILGASRILPDAIDPASITTEQRDAVLAAVRAYSDRSRQSLNSIARSCGLHGTELSRLLGNRPVRNWQAIILGLDRWIEMQAKAEQSPRPAEFVSTRIAEEIRAVAEVTASMRCIGLVCGPAGIGKTIALKAVAADRPGSIFVSMQTIGIDTRAILTAIATAAGIRPGTGRQAELAASLIKALEGSGRLIIVDEIHKLASREDTGLHVLRDLHDAAGVPMLWAGTIDLIAYLERREAGGCGREPLSQIRSRIGIARNLGEGIGSDRGPHPSGGGSAGSYGMGEPLYTVDEVRRIFARSKMRLTPEAIHYLWRLANLPESGALRTCNNLVSMAIRINGDAAALTDEHLRAVHRLLVSGHAYAALSAALEPAPARQAVKVG